MCYTPWMLANILGHDAAVSWREFFAILCSMDRPARFVAGSVDLDARTLTLLTGSMRTCVLNLKEFRECPTTKPDFGKLEIIDYGSTIKFGEYEACGDAVYSLGKFL